MQNAAYIFVFSEHVFMLSAVYISFITFNSISALDSGKHFWVEVNCAVSVKVRSHQKYFQVTNYAPYIVTCIQSGGYLHC